jgi:hypothetical protein
VQRRIFGQKSDEVTGEWVALHNEELHNLCSLPSFDSNYQVKENEMGRACNTNGEKRNIYIENICAKARRKETTRKTKKWMGGF